MPQAATGCGPPASRELLAAPENAAFTAREPPGAPENIVFTAQEPVGTCTGDQ